MNKKGKLYVVILCLFMLLLLIVAYVQLVKFYSKHPEFGVTKDIGSKQGAILGAIQEGERVQLYVKEAFKLSMREAGRAVRCGEPYLGRTIVRMSDSCTIQKGSSDAFRSAFNRHMLNYPGDAMDNAQWQEISGSADRISVQGTVRIPLEIGRQAQERREQQQEPVPFGGTYDSWPTPTQKINSYFGNRDIPCRDPAANKCPSKNHPGLDISTLDPATDSNIGTPVRALGGGMAEYRPDSYQMYIRVFQDDGAIVEYVHIEALKESNAADQIVVPRMPSRVRVEAGQVIGKSAAIGAPHLHLQVRFPIVGASTLQELNKPTDDGKSWQEHISISTEHTAADTSYAVVRTSDDAAFLNPICFFEREKMRQIVQDSVTTNDAQLEAKRRSQAFVACDYYGVLGLEGKLLTASAAEQQEPAAEQPVATEAITTSGTAPPLVKQTQENIQRLNLMPAIEEAAQKEGVDPKLMLAIITQESQGIPDAISPTGPAGIAQFSASTARGYFEESDRPNIKACCDGGETGAACQDKSLNQCNEQTDPRFDPVKSVHAQAKFLKNNYDYYKNKNYEQHVAFAIAAYNGGKCPVDYALNELGSGTTLSWEQVETKMRDYAKQALRIKCADDDNYAPRWNEIADYGTKVTQWYQAWGGVTFAGTPYSSENIGYYDLMIRLEEKNPVMFAATLQQAQQKSRTCTTVECINQALLVAGMANRVDIFPVELGATTPVCMQKDEATLAYYANQVQWCLSSPDTDCNCPLETQVDAVLAVSGEQLQLQKINDINVQAKPMVGLAYPSEGEEEETYVVRFYSNIGNALNGEIGTLNAAERTVQIQHTKTGFIGLYKTPDNKGVAFTDVDKPTCVLPPKPTPYCMNSIEFPDIKAVTYVDNIPSGIPSATINDLQALHFSGDKAKINFTSDAELPYLYIIVHKPEGDTELYLNIRTVDPLDIESAVENPDDEVKRTPAGVYEVDVPLAPQYTVALMDQFLHEVGRTRVRTEQGVPTIGFGNFDISSLTSPLTQ